MIKKKASEYFKAQYHQPTNESDLVTFAKQVLVEFIKELENKKQTVKWNYGLDEVVFLKKIEELKELYECRDDQSNSDESLGAGASGDNERDTNDDWKVKFHE
jgi:hypothetical protein